MFARLVSESFVRNPRRKILTAAALVVGMAVATATLSVALEVGDHMAREFRSLGANLLVTPQSDSLPLEIGGVDYRPVDQGAYLKESDLGKLKTVFWRNNIIGFTPFLDVPATVAATGGAAAPAAVPATVIGTWFDHGVAVPDGSVFRTGLRITHPYWKVEGRWFADGSNECVVGAALANRLGIAAGAAQAGAAPVAMAPTIQIHADTDANATAQSSAAGESSCTVTGVVST